MVEETTATETARAVPSDLLEILVCPIDKATLRAEASALICTQCGRHYPVEDGIPNMLVEE